MRKKVRKKRGCSSAIVIMAVIFLCIGSWRSINWIYKLPTIIEANLGSPAKSLSPTEKYSLSLELWLKSDSLLTPTNESGNTVRFEIKPGESANQVIFNLAELNIITNTNIFRKYLIYTGYEHNIQVGIYDLSAAMTPVEIANSIIDKTSQYVTFAILAGWRIEEIAQSLPLSGLQISETEFLTASKNIPSGYSFSGILKFNQSMEGFLHPGIYEVPRNINAAGLLNIFLSKTEASLTDDILAGIDKQGLSIYEAIIIASIVEREAVIQDEQSIIASVFLNRIAIGMRLEADPTVQYAIGFNPIQSTWWTNPLSTANLGFDSPYNSYLYTSLPPTPIANPSLEAIIAVANSAHTEFYYFRAKCDNSNLHNFSNTYQQHVAFGC